MRRDHAFDVVRHGLVQAPRCRVLEDLGHGVLGILLVGSDHPGRASLDPARRVLAGLVPAFDVDHAPAFIADEATPLVKLNVADRLTGVADRAEHEPGRDLLERSGTARGQPAVIARDDYIVLDLDGAYVPVVVAEELDWRGEEAETHGDGPP